MKYFMEYDVAVVGAGHAGIEASLASARLGAKTVVFSINLDSIGNCPCSPSIGGTAKGTLVREIDSLGGEMAKTTDECFLHSKILNASKGPAAQSIRAQVDKNKYKILMKHKLETQQNLHIHQCEIVEMQKFENFWILKTNLGTTYKCKAVVLATGTFLGGKIHIGDVSYSSGPDGVFASNFLTNSIQNLNIPTKRFKTGTSARILKSSINFDLLEVQPGDEKVTPFSYDTENIGKNKLVCHIAWTNQETKKVIRENIDKSPMYSHKIHATGPRYCPSIEDKIMRFSEKERHQIFVEPCGIDTDEIYLYGMSSCLPEEIQIKFLRTIKGFENCVITRPGYAIEYDIIDPTSIFPTLELKKAEGIFTAGQLNGSSGYEEAAAQGLIAGINAAMHVLRKDKLILNRSNSYIGTLIDDLTTKGVNDPYRMLTARSEYRLYLRVDNADERLTPIGRKIGLVSDKYWDKFQNRINQKEKEKERIKSVFIKANESNNRIIEKFGIPKISESVRLEYFLRRPEVNYDLIKLLDKEVPNLPEDILKRVEIEVKYAGYIKLQKQQIEKLAKFENCLIPKDFNYLNISNLRLEAREKLSRINPINLLQAKQIPGITPADISTLIIWIEKMKRRGKN